MVDMKNRSIITVWEGCAPTVSDAIGRFQERCQPYSESAKRYPIARLIEELIDPAVAAYSATLPSRYLGYIPGAGTGVPFSEIMKLVGTDAMVRLQRQLLRAFVLTEDKQSERDQRFIATLETMMELVWASKRKQPKKRDVRGLNHQRVQSYCRFCGNLAEFASFAEGKGKRGADDQLRLSNLYCATHRPLLPDGKTWNPAYSKAKRSVAQFDLELRRLSLQSANLRTPLAKSDDPLIDSYIYHYVRKYGLQPADEAELRHHARRMADMKFTDQKKRIVMLQRYGVSQSEISRMLRVSRQAVSKALSSIPDPFRELPTCSGFPSYFLRQLK
ncbi:TPA: LuxR family transcriptional regulator [Klebsiella pneumoniae]|uniref:LuxR family transcriptional regulator n=1 Tax=Serratia marcescens TaxID=615 RepID=UPI0018D95F2D|nr:LuxR family transcriptional regulator [Serratia marcescens]MDU2857448.1 LuxR family transcriptional regulator [Serratia marcescens]HEJ6919859.1 LuxR family transcriptional regulator [Serratia marcescens]HEJ8080654.1 LuxR family transcriptional regulator [Serratia marcescens]